MGIVHEHVGLVDVGEFDQPQLPVGSHHDTTLSFGAERDGFAVHEVDHHLVADLLLGDVRRTVRR